MHSSAAYCADMRQCRSEIVKEVLANLGDHVGGIGVMTSLQSARGAIKVTARDSFEYRARRKWRKSNPHFFAYQSRGIKSGDPAWKGRICGFSIRQDYDESMYIVKSPQLSSFHILYVTIIILLLSFIETNDNAE